MEAHVAERISRVPGTRGFGDEVLFEGRVMAIVVDCNGVFHTDFFPGWFLWRGEVWCEQRIHLGR